MAKKNNVVPADSGGSDSVFGSIKGVIVISIIGGILVHSIYSAGSSVSDKVLRSVNKERRKHEKDKRRELKERKKEEQRQYKLELLKAKRKKR